MIDWESEKENLRRMYIVEGLSMSEISRKYDIPRSTLVYRLKIFGITRSEEDITKLKIDSGIIKICPICGKQFYSNYKEQKYCSYNCNYIAHRKIPNYSKEELISIFNRNNWNYSKIGEFLGISDKAVAKWAEKYGIHKSLQEKSRWSVVIDLETAQNKIDEFGIKSASELYHKFKGLAYRIRKLGISTKDIKFQTSVFDSSWEGTLYNYIISHYKDIGYTNIYHNIILNDECKYERPLMFDIVLEYQNLSKIVIEIQGPTHFKKVYNNKGSNFEIIRKRDEIKYQYCLYNNIDLYYFTYDQSLLDLYGYPHYVYTSEDLLLEKLKSYSGNP